MFIAIRDPLVRYASKDLFEGLKLLNIKWLELYLTRELKFSDIVVKSIEKHSGRKFSLKNLEKTLEDKGIKICALLLESDFSSPDFEKEVEYILRACDIASILGVSVLRVDGPKTIIEGFDVEDYVKISLKILDKVLPVCSRYGISLGIENHGLITNNPEYLRKLFKETDEIVGLTLDTGNFYWYGLPLKEVYKIIKEFAPRVKHTHIKNAIARNDVKNVRRKPGEVKMAPLPRGDIDLTLVINIIKEAGYDWDLTIEDESLWQFKEKALEILREDIEFLKKLI